MIVTKVVAVLERNGLYAAGIFTPHGVYATSLPRSSEKAALASVNGVGIERSKSPKYLHVLKIVHSVFNGETVDTDNISFDYSELTENETRVLETVRAIPRGETRTYGQIAKMAGLANAARFVGNVMARNRFAPIIPCHRVVASNGLGGYSGGEGFDVGMKKNLLIREGAKIAKN